MRIPAPALLLGLALSFFLALLAGNLLLAPPLPLIRAADFDRAAISPNADGIDDVAVFRYSLARPAQISLSLHGEDGDSYFFRQAQPRADDDYAVHFSGVVDGYLRPDESLQGTIERRLVPDGNYEWRLLAETADGESASARGQLQVTAGDGTLPRMPEFQIAPSVFSPNQDGIADRVSINIYLTKDVARLDVYLVGADGARIPISARIEERQYGEAGRHRFDYEGGIDLGVDPPPDGRYQVQAIAQDAVGQRIRRTGQLQIELGGKPYAEIKPQAVGAEVAFQTMPYDERYFSSAEGLGELLPDIIAEDALPPGAAITVPLGHMLVFRLTVDNYSDVPIRTSGPPPGTVYQQQQLAGSLGMYDESGVWRVGIQCETSMVSFPYRWAIAPDSALQFRHDDTSGNSYGYLPPKARAVVWGGLRFTQVKARNPQNCWAGLIHEDVAVSLRNNHVGMRSIMVLDPVSGNTRP